MALKVFMPKLTHDMEAGVLLEWHKKEGDEVQKGEPLFAVETDKAAVDVEAEVTGVLRGLRFDPGDEVPVGEVVGWGEKRPLIKQKTSFLVLPKSPRPRLADGSWPRLWPNV